MLAMDNIGDESNSSVMVFGSTQTGEKLKQKFGDRVRVHAAQRRKNRDVPDYLERLRQAQIRSEKSQFYFG